MNLIKVLIAGSILILIAQISSLIISLESDEIYKQRSNSNLITSIYKIENGYGYSLSNNTKILIKQDFIPGAEGKHPFCNIEDAQNIANLVKKRIKNKQNPRITKDDLNTLKIKLNCLDLQ